DLIGSIGYNGLDNLASESQQQVLDREARSYTVGVVVNSPLTFKAERSRYRAAKFDEQQATLLLAQTEQSIVVSLGNAANQIETTRKRVAATSRAMVLANEALDAELKKLRAGTGSTFVVLAQQEILSSAEIANY